MGKPRRSRKWLPPWPSHVGLDSPVKWRRYGIGVQKVNAAEQISKSIYSHSREAGDRRLRLHERGPWPRGFTIQRAGGAGWPTWCEAPAWGVPVLCLRRTRAGDLGNVDNHTEFLAASSRHRRRVLTPPAASVSPAAASTVPTTPARAAAPPPAQPPHSAAPSPSAEPAAPVRSPASPAARSP